MTLADALCAANARQNRSLGNVVLGGYGIPAPSKVAAGPVEKLVHVETNSENVAEMLVNAKSVVIAPGYGLAGAFAGAVAADFVWYAALASRLSRALSLQI